MYVCVTDEPPLYWTPQVPAVGVYAGICVAVHTHVGVLVNPYATQTEPATHSAPLQVHWLADVAPVGLVVTPGHGVWTALLMGPPVQ